MHGYFVATHEYKHVILGFALFSMENVSLNIKITAVEKYR